MFPISHPFSLNLLVTLFFMILKSTSPAPTLLAYFCSNTTEFQPNSQYQSDLNTVFRSLSSNGTEPDGFSIATAGNAAREGTVYGLFLCRGDQNATACRDCVATATSTDLPSTYCPNRKEAVIWYDECMVRYSNESFFGRVDMDPGQLLWNTQNVTGNLTRFADTVRRMMDDISSQAANGGIQKKYATSVEGFTSLQTLYALAQCTPDLSTGECNECLNVAVGELPISIGGRVLLPSCNVRYEIYPFFNGAANVSSPQAPPQTPPVQAISPPRGKKLSTKAVIAIIVPVAVVSMTLLAICICFFHNKAKRPDDNVADTGEDFTDAESLQYDLDTLQSITNYFSLQNKLGEGGFGGVYKGKLENGTEVAVKRLSQGSGQGAQEFKNEVSLVAKLQHRNLVRLLGFCLAGDEKLLVYEYVPNKSLDYFLFDPAKRVQLDWARRYKIIVGIARGMLYLHQDSPLRIIHRDLKASNILLDADMNPKISDFGMARIVGLDQTQGNTSRVVGTFGYMSPEYAMHGKFSDKSDVYSFGVLVMEILSGKRNSMFYQSSSTEDLLSHAWKQWRDRTPLEFVDPTIRDSCSVDEVMRCIHLALLCVQESVEERPTMAAVVLTLDSYSVNLEVPKQPVFLIKNQQGTNFSEATTSDQSSNKQYLSVNDVSITDIVPR